MLIAIGPSDTFALQKRLTVSPGKEAVDATTCPVIKSTTWISPSLLPKIRYSSFMVIHVTWVAYELWISRLDIISQIRQILVSESQGGIGLLAYVRIQYQGIVCVDCQQSFVVLNSNRGLSKV